MIVKAKTATRKKRTTKAKVIEAAIKEETSGYFPSDIQTVVQEKAVEAAPEPIDFFEAAGVPDLAKMLENVDWEHPIDASDQSVEQRLGVMQRLITAELDLRRYLQTLLMGAFKDERQAGYCADAITEAQRYGCSIQPIMNRIYAQCGIRSERALQVLGAINSYTINTRNNGGSLPKWKKDQQKKQIA